MQEILDFLFANQDLKYKAFMHGLTPNLGDGDFIGVRTPVLKKYAASIKNTQLAKDFLKELPHKYFEENQIHAFILASIKDYEECMAGVEVFLPYVNNWATGDQLNSKCFAKNKDKLLVKIGEWLKSDEEYTVRFGIRMLMVHFLDEDFNEEYLDAVAGVRSDAYYIKMMVAWYFAEALAKQYDVAVKYIEQHRLGDWEHRKAITKANESFKISPERKEYLKSFR